MAHEQRGLRVPRDIDEIIRQVCEQVPDVTVKQLAVIHEGDDDGLWFFRRPGFPELQLESSSGNLPFLMETDANNLCQRFESISSVVAAVVGAPTQS